MKKPPARVTRIRSAFTPLTSIAVAHVLTVLQRHYAHVQSVVLHPLMAEHLPVLRTLESIGLVRIESVALNKHWIATPAGVLWLHMYEAKNTASFRLDDFLVEPIYGWMTNEEVCSAASLLVKLKLAHGLDEQHAPIEYFHLQRVVLHPKRSVIPGLDEYRRFFREPDPMEQYG